MPPRTADPSPEAHPAPEWNAADYARHSRLQNRWGMGVIEGLALRGGETVLDLGCGDGRLTAQLARRVPQGRVVGADLSESMLALARKQFPPAVCPNLSFVRMDFSSLALPANFDVVFSNAALHWVRDHRPVLAGVARCLRPGGRLLAQMGGRGNAAGVFKALQPVMKADAWRAYFENFSFRYGFHSPEEYGPWLREAGLDPVRLELIPRDMAFENREEFAGWIRTTWMPYTQRVPAETRDAFIRECVERYLAARPPREDGRIHVDMMRLEVEARKNGKDAPAS